MWPFVRPDRGRTKKFWVLKELCVQSQLAERAAAQKELRHKSGKKKRTSAKMDDSVISNVSSDLSDFVKDEDNILSEDNGLKKKSVSIIKHYWTIYNKYVLT